MYICLMMFDVYVWLLFFLKINLYLGGPSCNRVNYLEGLRAKVVISTFSLSNCDLPNKKLGYHPPPTGWLVDFCFCSSAINGK